MPQTLALLAEGPTIDTAASMRKGQAVFQGDQAIQKSAQDYRKGEQDYEHDKLRMARTRLDNSVASAKSADTLGAYAALAKYRKAAEAGDPNANDVMRAYPEALLPVVEAHRKLADDPKKQRDMEDRALWMGERALTVGNLTPGSPERISAWNEALDEGVKRGYIDPRLAGQWRNNPTDMVIDQARQLGALGATLKNPKASTLSVDQVLEIEKIASKTAGLEGNIPLTGRDRDKAIAEKDRVRAELTARALASVGGRSSSVPAAPPAAAAEKPPEGPGLWDKAKEIGGTVVDAVGDAVGSVGGSVISGLGQLNKKLEAERIARERAAAGDQDAPVQGQEPSQQTQPAGPAPAPEFGLAGPGAPAAPVVRPEFNRAGVKGAVKPKIPATHAKAITPRSKEEFDALPKGTPFINGADGRALWKQ